MMWSLRSPNRAIPRKTEPRILGLSGERYVYSGHNSYFIHGTGKIVETAPILKSLGGPKSYKRGEEWRGEEWGQISIIDIAMIFVRSEQWREHYGSSWPAVFITSPAVATSAKRSTATTPTASCF